ncbi:MAG TPA: TolC family protein [Chitinispirillaceae bacterium]|nr:TolC family protein [Chitinispirillaceae bacterium]
MHFRFFSLIFFIPALLSGSPGSNQMLDSWNAALYPDSVTIDTTLIDSVTETIDKPLPYTIDSSSVISDTSDSGSFLTVNNSSPVSDINEQYDSDSVVLVPEKYSKEPVVNMTISDAIELLLKFNSEIIRAKLEWLATQDKYKAAFGNFEPAFISNFKYDATNRSTSLLTQQELNFTSGIEGLLPSATKYSLNFSQTDIRSSFSDNLEKPVTFAGVSLTQPLLQGLWFGKPVIEIKFASTEKSIALHKYRSTLFSKIYELETAYWKLCLSQQKVLFSKRSVEIAREIVSDAEIQIRTGKISQLESLEASAGLASRQSNLTDAQKELMAAMGQLKLLIADHKFSTDTLINAATPLQMEISDSTDDSYIPPSADSIYILQPDYLQKKYELDKEILIQKYQTDQCLPELNLKGTWGYQVRASSGSKSWYNFWNKDYRRDNSICRAEIELRIPLGMRIKERNMLAAEKRNVLSAQTAFKSTEKQVMNMLTVAIKRLEDIKRNLKNAKIVIDYRESLLKTEIIRQKAGKSNFRKIFEIEEDLTKTLQWEMENIIDLNATSAELARLTGFTLLNSGLETIENNNPVLNQILIQAK